MNRKTALRIVNETIDEFEAYHGSDADFNSFDIAYMGSGMASQSYGDGIYLATDKRVGEAYAGKGTLYTVEIPDIKDHNYLSDDKICPKAFVTKVISKFMKWFFKTEPGNLYIGNEREVYKMLQSMYGCDGVTLHGTITSFTGSDLMTNEFLRSIGIYGLIHSVHANDENGKPYKPNIVMYDQNDIKIVKKEKQSVQEGTVNEYYDKYYMNPLRKYVKALRQDNTDDILNVGWRYFEPFLSANKDAQDKFDELEQKGKIKDFDYYDYDDVINVLNNLMPEYKKPFVKFCENKINSKGFYNYDEYPMSMVMDYTREVHNEWLVHFTDHAYEIHKTGFMYGVDSYENLAYSGAGSIKNKYGPGFNFAYKADEAYKAFDGRYGSKPKYGESCILFRASGIQMTHYGDEEEQVIFYGPSARDLIFIEYSDYDGEWYVESEINGNRIVHNEDLQKVVYWCIANFAQYNQHLVGRKNQRFRFDMNRQRKLVSEQKERKNDEGKRVPEKCTKCGANIKLVLQGEPIYKCEKCGKYYGTVPFNDSLNEKFEKDWEKGAKQDDDDYPDVIEINGKFNYKTNMGELLIPNKMFDYCGKFSFGAAVVQDGKRWNFVDVYGNLLSPYKWFDRCYKFHDGVGRVVSKDKENFMNKYGKMIISRWFDDSREFKDGFGKVLINGNWKYIDFNGNIYANKPLQLYSPKRYKAIKEAVNAVISKYLP